MTMPENAGDERERSGLRERAEVVVEKLHSDVEHLPPMEIRRLVHELEVHQIELQMQNDELLRTQRELAESRDRLADLYDFAPVGYLTLERDSTIREMNLPAAHLLGSHRTRLIGERFTRFVTYESQDELFLHHRMTESSGCTRSCELMLSRADGTRFHAQLDSRVEPSGKGFRCVILDITPRKRAEEALRDLTSKLEHRVHQRTAELAAATIRLESQLAERRQLERQIETIAEAERQSIGLDLHDGIVQILSGLRYKLEALVQSMPAADPGAEHELRSIAGHLREAIQQARMLARGLQPVEPMPEGLRTSLRQLAESTTQLSGIPCFCAIHGPGLVDDHLAAIHLFRIAQEAVTNAVKHGHPNTIRISLRDRKRTLALSVINDGGAPERLSREDGLGIRSMSHRASRIDARFECRPHFARGTLVRCLLRRCGGADGAGPDSVDPPNAPAASFI